MSFITCTLSSILSILMSLVLQKMLGSLSHFTVTTGSNRSQVGGGGGWEGGGLGTRLGWGPGNEARVGGSLGTRLGWGPGNETKMKAQLPFRLGSWSSVSSKGSSSTVKEPD